MIHADVSPISVPEPLQSIVETMRDQYAATIATLDEATARPKAAARTAELHTANSLPVHRAKALLASLPTEQTETKERPTMTTNIDAEKIVTRRVEIRVAALSTRAAQGDARARAEAKRLNQALSIKQRSPQTSIMAALATAGANIEAIRNMRSA